LTVTDNGGATDSILQTIAVNVPPPPGAWWDSSWEYRKSLEITNSGANALTDYQVLIEVDTAALITAGKMRSDAGDLRFTDSTGTELSYWIESGINTSATKIWVKVPSIPALGTATIYMYYGNPDAASTSSGGNTFEFFDDFEGGLGKWTNFGSPSPVTFSSTEFHDGWGYSTEGDSWYPSGSYSKTLVNVAEGIVIEARLKVKDSTSDWDYLGLGIGSLQSGYNDGSGTPGTLDEVYFAIHVSGAQYPSYAQDVIAYHNMWWDHPVSSAVYMESNDFGWHRYTIKYDPLTTVASYYKDEVFKVENSSGPRPYDALPVVMCGRDYYSTNYLDFVFVRKYADPEPTYAFGSEERVPAVNQPPTASFVYEPTSPTTADIIHFTDQSTDPDGTISSWSWDFGDGTTSTEQNPTHQYSSADTYTVTLTVTDNGGATDSYSTTISVELANQPPTASFVYEPTSPTTADIIHFTDQSTDPDGTISSWSWNFGDGTTSTEQNPTHQYSSADTYTVTLTVTDNGGATDTVSQSIAVSIPEKIPTTLWISPPSFTIQSDNPITLTATLRVSDNMETPLANKLISWTVSTERENKWTLPVALGRTMTDSFGQTSITYTAPDVTAETRVKITASFAGDDDYLGSSGISTGTITPTALTPTSILISPLVFDAESEENVVLTVLLTGEDGVPLAGKLIHLSTTQGVVTPTSATTDDLGRATATFTAPQVDVRTSFILSATFAGDNEHSPSHAYSTGTVRSATLARTVEKIEQSIERIEVRVEELETTVEALVEKLENALVENRLGTIIAIENAQGRREYEHAEVEAEIEVRGTNIEVRVDSGENYKTILVNIDDYTKKVLQLDRIGVWVDNVQIDLADDYDDVLDPTDDGDKAEYLVLLGDNGVQVLVSIPRFSTRTITIAALPTVPTVEAPPPYILIVAALVIMVVLVVIIWRYLWVGARKLPKLRQA
jgi:PKD repeat protein